MIKHSLSHTPEYNTWASMKNRCLNPTNMRWEHYGGRGITICERWMDVKNFYLDMGKKPSKEHSIDRIDNDGNYEPSNCRWASILEQACNKGIQKDNKLRVKGVTLLSEGRYQARIGIHGKVHSLGVFKTLEEAAKARKDGELIYHPKKGVAK